MDAKDVQVILGQMQKNLECSICLEMMANPVSTNCGHQFCRFCLMEFLGRKRQAPCPLCKKTITKRSLTERAQLGGIINSIRQLIAAFQMDTGMLFSPPHGSQANILPSTPEPTLRSNQATSSRVRQQKELADLKPRSSVIDIDRDSIPDCLSFEDGGRKRARDNCKFSRLETTSDDTSELLKCIAEGLHGAKETAVASEHGETESKESSGHSGAVIDEETEDYGKAGNEALLDIIENGSHGADGSNSEEINEVDIGKTSAKTKSIAEKNIKTGKDAEIGHANISDVHSRHNGSVENEILAISENSDQKEGEVVASGCSSSCYPLFRTPVEPEKGKVKKIDTKSISKRPRRSCRSKDSGEAAENVEKTEFDNDAEFEYENGHFSDQTKVLHTYTRKNKSDILKGKKGTQKVAEWLKNISTATCDSDETPEVILDRSKVSSKQTQKKTKKLLAEEDKMGQRIKHLAEQVHGNNKDLFFNVEDFATSPIQGDTHLPVNEGCIVDSVKDMENVVKEDSVKVDNCYKDTDKGVSMIEEHKVVEMEIPDMAMSKDKKSTIEEELTKERLMLQKTDTLIGKDKAAKITQETPFIRPPQKKRIFKTKGPVVITGKRAVNGQLKCEAVLNETASDCIGNKQMSENTVKCDTEESNLSKKRTENVSDPFEFVSSQNTPIKAVKGKKNEKKKTKVSKGKNKPTLVLEAKSRANGSTKLMGGSKLTALHKDCVIETKSVSRSILKLTSHTDIEKASAKLEQAENYDLLTCTHEAMEDFVADEERTKTCSNNKKTVSFREPVISDFIQEGRIDIVGYRHAKATHEKETSEKTADLKSCGEKAGSIEANGHSVGDGSNKGQVNHTHEHPASTVKENHVETDIGAEKMDVGNHSDDDESGDWRFGEDSSGTDDLDIEPAPEEYEQPNIDIQTAEMKARLSQEAFEKTVLLKAIPSPDPSIIGETPLVGIVPKFNKNPSNSTATKQYREPKADSKMKVVKLSAQQVVPETPVIPFESLDVMSEGSEVTDLQKEPMKEIEHSLTKESDLKECSLEKAVHSSEETQAPSLEIEGTGTIANNYEEFKYGQEGTEHVRNSNSSDLECLASYNVTDSCSQNSESILLSKYSDRNIPAKSQNMKDDVNKKDFERINLCNDSVSSETKAQEKLENESLKRKDSTLLTHNMSSKPKRNCRSLLTTSGKKTKKGRRKNISSSEGMDEVTDIYVNSIDSLPTGDINSNETVDSVSHSDKSRSPLEIDSRLNSEIDVIAVSVSQPSSSSVQSPSQTIRKNQKEVEASVCEDVCEDVTNKVDRNTIDTASKVNVLESPEKVIDTGTYSVTIVPDSVMETDMSEVLESNGIEITDIENEDTCGIRSKTPEAKQDGDGSSKKKSSEKSLRSKKGKSTSQESIRQRNVSGVLVSPEVHSSNSSENIFGMDSEMPAVESSPFDDRLQPVHLPDEESCTQTGLAADAVVTVVDCSDNVKSAVYNSPSTDGSQNSSYLKKSKVANFSLERQKQIEQSGFATPSPQRKRRSASSRGSSKRQRCLDNEQIDLTVSCGVSPHSKLPETPKASLNQQVLSPATKYMSPKLMVTHNLPLIGQSPIQKPSPLCNRTSDQAGYLNASTPLKPAVVSPALSCKYSPLQHKERTIKAMEVVDKTVEVEVVDVATHGESDEESEIGTPTVLPDLDNHEILDIHSSSECVPNKKKKNSPRIIIDNSGINRSVDGSTDTEKREKRYSLEKTEFTNNGENIVSDSFQHIAGNTRDKIESCASNEEMEVLEETKSIELNLDSSVEEDNSDIEIKIVNENMKKKVHETEHCPSSPEFTLDSSGEQSLQEQALKEIEKFNEIKENMNDIITRKPDKSIDDGSAAVSGKNIQKYITIEDEDDNRYSSRLDSSPVQPEVILESDVDSDAHAAPMDDSDSESEEEVVRRKRVKKVVIDSSSDDDDDESSRHMNLTSSSAFSSQSENLTTQERFVLEKDLEKMEREMRAMKEQLKKNKKNHTTELLPLCHIDSDNDSDNELIEADDTDDEMEQELFMSLPPVSPSNSQQVCDQGEAADVEKEQNSLRNDKGDKYKPEIDSEMETVPPSLSELTDVETVKRPVLADIDVNVIRPLPSPGKKRAMGFVSTGLSTSQIHEVKKLAAVNDVKFYNRFNSSVTHVIVKPDPEDDRLCDRTLKFFQGIAHRCWIVNHFWVVDSRQLGHMLPEDAYEIHGDTATGEAHHGPRRSRLAKDKLFMNIHLSLIGENTYLSRDSLKELIEGCGGTVVDVEAGSRKGGQWFVICCTDMEEEGSKEGQLMLSQSKELYRRHRVLTLTREWVLDSITLYKLQQLPDYIVTSVKNADIPRLT